MSETPTPVPAPFELPEYEAASQIPPEDRSYLEHFIAEYGRPQSPTWQEWRHGLRAAIMEVVHGRVNSFRPHISAQAAEITKLAKERDAMKQNIALRDCALAEQQQEIARLKERIEAMEQHVGYALECYEKTEHEQCTCGSIGSDEAGCDYCLLFLMMRKHLELVLSNQPS